MNDKIAAASRKMLADCLGLRVGESLLVVADDGKQMLGEAVRAAGTSLGAEAVLMVMSERTKSGEEPPKAVASAMEATDAVVCITEYSLTHTAARKRAAAAGARVATMPGVTEDMFLNGAITADYLKVKALTDTLTAKLSESRSVRIEKAGHSLSFSIEGRNGVPSTGLYLLPGESGNLPSGEAYIAPVEGTAAGSLLADGSVAGYGPLASPLLLTVEQGRLTAAEGDGADALLSMLGEGDGRLLGEFGIGTNDKARITGVVLEDEKVYGTIHIAFGNNHTFGGQVSAGVHIDIVVKEPDVYLDGRLVIAAGKLV
ncbi:Leucyl aminopeptidase (aminopeptidase T) [Paenibacillus sophorae]|uniref:Aminopeptidase n=1 Tax=Paenibacillus sophorae TaxID=1333845 RepID=A0A1H8PBU6_9BACL|nr:aminopeptidase [Paenibacillus sophorae]QWU16513.1 aminopeptidase [Paenibacillus sophorae]SEO39247.1 Leucyl aminopeptidase (aminopeptidase T) [Paenibacillus sophorae]